MYKTEKNITTKKRQSKTDVRKLPKYHENTKPPHTEVLKSKMYKNNITSLPANQKQEWNDPAVFGGTDLK